MALSKSIVRAQDIIYCQLCETEPKMKWKCLECKLLMCQKCCVKIHPKFKNAKDHQIIDIKEVGQVEERQAINLNNIKCTSHTDEACCLYCESCELLVCPVCITKGHKGHSFMEIKAFYQQMYEKLKDKVQNLGNKEDDLDLEMDKLQGYESSQKTKHQLLLASIEEQKKCLVQQADDCANKLTNEANDKMKAIQNSVSKEKNKMLRSQQEMSEHKTRIKQILDLQNAQEFFRNKNEMFKDTPEDYKSSIDEICCMPTFQPGASMSEIFGSLVDNKLLRNMKLKIMAKYITELERCNNLSFGDDGCLWLAQQVPNCENGVLNQIFPKEGKKLITNIYPTKSIIFDIKYHSNNILIADRTSKLKVVTNNTDETSIKIVDSKYKAPDKLIIVGFDFTHEGDVVLATRSTEKNFPIKGRRAVVKLNQIGQQKWICECDQNKKRVFSSPRNVCSTTIGNSW